MAVAHDASSQSHASASFSVSQASFSWTHTPTGTPKGVVVLVFQGVASADAVTSVTYGGTTMTHVSSARAADTATEPGSVDVYFLGSSVSTGAQTVQVNRTNNTTSMWAVCSTQTAATDTEIAGIVLVQNDGAIAQQSVDDGSTGVDSVRYSGVYYGGATPAPAGANSTLLGTTNDAGAYGWTAVRETTAGQGSRLVGCTQATSDDRAIVAFAVREVYVPPGPNPVDVQETAWTGSTSPLTTTHSGALSGDKILVISIGDGGLSGGANSVTAATTTTTSGTTGAWTEIEEELPASGGRGWLHSAICDVTANGSVTTSTARTQASTARNWGKWSVLLRDAGAVGTHSKTTSGAAENISLSVSQDSFVAFGSFDWDAAAVPSGFTPSGVVEVERTQDGANGTFVTGYWRAQAAGTRSYGGNDTSSSTNINAIAIEILAASSGITGTVAVTQASDTSTASGQLGYSGTSAATQAANTSSATGTVSGPVTGTAAVTQANQTSTASGQLGYSGTVAATQAAQTSTATGQLGYSGTAAASQAAQTSSASGTYTAGGSFAGTVAVTQANQTASATGQLGYSGTVARTQANNTSTASGTVINPVTGTASPTQANQTAAASGKLGYSGTVAATQAAQTSTASGLVVIAITGTVAVVQANQTSTASGSFTGLVTFGTASAGAGTRPTASAATAAAATASSGSMTVPTATGG